MNNLPYLTSSIPGIPATFKSEASDFIVEEIPSYLPEGEGEHLYVLVEKQNITTYEVVRFFCESLKIKEREIGYAGLKDAKAISRQWFSLRLVTEEQFKQCEHPKLKFLQVSLHKNKLRIGHLRGNRFQIVLRDIAASSVEPIQNILKVLEKQGVPNYFGEQRFGRYGDNHLIGKALLQEKYEEAIRIILGASENNAPEDVSFEARKLFDEGKWEPSLSQWPHFFKMERRLLYDWIKTDQNAEKVIVNLPRKMKYFYMSSYQSYIFNRCLEKRLETISQLFEGDVAEKVANRALFDVEEVEVEKERCHAFEISPSGPVFGPKMKMAKGFELDLEKQVLDEEEISPEIFKSPFPKIELSGTRRAYRFPIKEIEVEPILKGVQLSFELPKGCYATSVLREIIKNT